MTRLSRLHALALVVLLAGQGCGSCGDTEAGEGDESGAPGVATSGSGGNATAAATAAQAVTVAARRIPPATEESLIEAVARALSERDLTTLQGLAAPEYAADLRRIHDDDAVRFWRRGARLVDNVKSGVRIAHREDESGDTWRVLVAFGNGQEERMTFTRVEGVLKVEDL